MQVLAHTSAPSDAEVDVAATVSSRHGGEAINPALPHAAIDRTLRPKRPRVSVVIPVLDDARNLPYAMWRLPECVSEIVVVDARSTDDTAIAAALIRPDVRVMVEMAERRGVVFTCGLAAATGDIVIILDADGSDDRGEIEQFVDVLCSGVDLAKGSRFLPGGGSAELTHVRRFGTRALTRIVNMRCGTRFTDLSYGHTAFWRDCLQLIDADGRGFETRLMMSVAAAGLEMVEVPSFEHRRLHGTSNLHALHDGLRVLREVATTGGRFRRRCGVGRADIVPGPGAR